MRFKKKRNNPVVYDKKSKSANAAYLEEFVFVYDFYFTSVDGYYAFVHKHGERSDGV